MHGRRNSHARRRRRRAWESRIIRGETLLPAYNAVEDKNCAFAHSARFARHLRRRAEADAPEALPPVEGGDGRSFSVSRQQSRRHEAMKRGGGRRAPKDRHHQPRITFQLGDAPVPDPLFGGGGGGGDDPFLLFGGGPSAAGTEMLPPPPPVPVNVDPDIEVGVLKAILAREHYLGKLRAGGGDRAGSAAVLDLLDAVRLASVEVVEAVAKWRDNIGRPLPFLYRGENYLLRMPTDLEFLDGDPRVASLGWGLLRNPFVIPLPLDVTDALKGAGALRGVAWAADADAVEEEKGRDDPGAQGGAPPSTAAGGGAGDGAGDGAGEDDLSGVFAAGDEDPSAAFLQTSLARIRAAEKVVLVEEALYGAVFRGDRGSHSPRDADGPVAAEPLDTAVFARGDAPTKEQSAIVADVARRTLEMLKTHHLTLTACFRNFDKNSDNKVNLLELKRGFGVHARVDLTDAEAQSLFAAFDNDHSGAVDVGEMLDTFRALARADKGRSTRPRKRRRRQNQRLLPLQDAGERTPPLRSGRYLPASLLTPSNSRVLARRELAPTSVRRLARMDNDLRRCRNEIDREAAELAALKQHLGMGGPAGAALPLNASKEANPLLLDPSSGARVTVASAGPKGFTTFGDSSSGDILARNMLSGDASATGQDDSGVDGGGGAPGTAAAKDYEHRRLLRLGIRRREEALAKRRAEMLRKRTIRDNYACVEQKLAKEAQHELRRQLRDLGQEAAADTPNRRRARRKAARRRGQRQGSEGGADEGDEDLVARKSKKRSRPSGSSSACDLHRTLWQYVWTPHDRAGTLRRPHLITQHACALVTHVYAFVQSLLRIAHF